MQFIELVNKVLQRLREETVTTTSDNDYAALVGDFVNETIREVEDAWMWSANKITIEIPVTNQVFRYSLTSTNQRSQLLSCYNYTDKCKMVKVEPEVMSHWYFTHNPLQQGSPYYFTRNGIDADGVPIIDIYPIPDASYTLYCNLKVPRDIVTDDTDYIDLPPHPIILGAYAKAIQERGEDMGTNLVHAQKSYEFALSDAIAIDSRITGSQNDWQV